MFTTISKGWMMDAEDKVEDLMDDFDKDENGTIEREEWFSHSLHELRGQIRKHNKKI